MFNRILVGNIEFTLHDNLQMWENSRKEQSLNPYRKKGFSDYFRVELVPRAGVEPARVAPLVFETSASTDSAIWASKAGAKLQRKFELRKRIS